jgi:hypothetical protein
VDELISLLERELGARPPVEPEKKARSPLRWVLGTVGAVVVVLAVVGLVFQEDKQGSNPAPVPFNPIVNPDPVPPGPEPQPQRKAFDPHGRWEMISQVNPSIKLILTLGEDRPFQVQTQAGLDQFPASAGAFEYSPDARTFTFTGVNIQGIPFSEALIITGEHENHYHAQYSGSAWDLRKQ